MTFKSSPLYCRVPWHEETKIISCVHIGSPHLGTVVYTGSGTEVYNGVKSSEGFSNPAWRSQVRAGVEATTPFTGKVDERVFSGEDEVELVYVAPSGSYAGDTIRLSGTGGYFTPSVPDDPDLISIDAVRSLCLEKLSKRIRDTQRSFQGGVFLGELREALHTIRHPAQQLRTLVTSYVGSARSRARRQRHLKAKNSVVQNTWLEYQYAMAPLASDIEEGIRTLSKKGPYFREIKRIQVGADAPGVSKFTNHGYAYPTEGFTVNWTRRHKNTTSFRFICGLGGQPVGGLASSQAWGLQTSDFLPTVWELIPYSFLVDYFTNVGTVIDSWSAASADIRWICWTARTDCRVDVVGARSNNKGVYGASWRSESVKSSGNYHSRRVVQRDKWVGGVVPPFRFKLPGFGSKWINIAALATSRRA